MIRAQLVDIEGSRDRLYEMMYEIGYPATKEHARDIDKALVFECWDTDEDVVAGYVWFYRIDDEPETWVIHALVIEYYQQRFFTRNLVDTISGVVYALGCDVVLAENANKDLLMHFGATETDRGCELLLPFFWRKNQWGSRSRKQREMPCRQLDSIIAPKLSHLLQ